MEYTIPPLSIVFIVVALFAGMIIPIGLFLYFRKKKGADISPFFVGCVVFVFTLLLKSNAQMALALADKWPSIMENPWLYGLVGGLFAGVFEEVGRYAAFIIVYRKKLQKDINGLMYGAGHGGFEVIMILVFGMITNLVYALLIRSGQAGELLSAASGEISPEAYKTLFQTLADTPPYMFLVSIAERVAAVILQISLSVLVWFSVKNKKAFWLFPTAIAIHTLVDMFAVALQQLKVNIFIVESGVFLFAGLCAVLALRIWKRYATPFIPVVDTLEAPE